jgi:DNA-directed RNA polymerase
MEWTRQLAMTMSRVNKPMHWHTPSGFCVLQQRFDRSSRTVKTRIGDKIVKVALSTNTNKLNSRRQTQALAPNFIHSLDAAALHLTINAMTAKGVTDIAAIHDSYGTHASEMDLLSCALRKEFVGMYRAKDVLAGLRDELCLQLGTNTLPPPPPKGTLDIEEVQRSRYFFA